MSIPNMEIRPENRGKISYAKLICFKFGIFVLSDNALTWLDLEIKLLNIKNGGANPAFDLSQRGFCKLF